jgi:hypothetical protein
LGCCCVEVVVVVVFVVVGRIAYFIWPFQQLFCELHEKGAPNGDEEDKAKKKKSLRDKKKEAFGPNTTCTRHAPPDKQLEREREREREREEWC